MLTMEIRNCEGVEELSVVDLVAELLKEVSI